MLIFSHYMVKSVCNGTNFHKHAQFLCIAVKKEDRHMLTGKLEMRCCVCIVMNSSIFSTWSIKLAIFAKNDWRYTWAGFNVLGLSVQVYLVCGTGPSPMLLLVRISKWNCKHSFIMLWPCCVTVKSESESFRSLMHFLAHGVLLVCTEGLNILSTSGAGAMGQKKTQFCKQAKLRHISNPTLLPLLFPHAGKIILKHPRHKVKEGPQGLLQPRY